MLKNLLGVALALMALEDMAYPTSAQIAEARPLVVALMADDVAAEKANRKTAEAVGDAALALVPKASGEAAKLQLFEGAFQYYVRGRAYGKAAQTIHKIRSEISDVEPKMIVDLIRSTAKGVKGSSAPELFAIYRTARFQVTMQETLSKTRIALRKTPNDKDLVRKLGEAQALSGDWKSALETFAHFKGGVGIHARAEKNGRDLFEAANFWWSYESFAGADGTAIFRGHAVALYRQVLEGGELDGLRKEVAEKRIAQVAGNAAEIGKKKTSERQTPQTDDVAVNEHEDNAKKPVELKDICNMDGLLHCWRFNGSAADEMGGESALLVGNASQSDRQCTLHGGNGPAENNISLGGGKIPNDGSPFTIELWATNNKIEDCSRIFSFGQWDRRYCIDVTWGYHMSLAPMDIWVCDNLTRGGVAPCKLGQEYHFAFVFKPIMVDLWELRIYKQNVKTGMTIMKVTVKIPRGITFKGFRHELFHLGLTYGFGRSAAASASYNEVRVWKRALSERELTQNAIRFYKAGEAARD